MPYARKRHHDGHTRLRRRNRLRNFRKDLDQIDKDLKEDSEKLLNQEIDFDTPGFAQFYCLHCAKHFINQRALDDHFKTKVHKRRLKALQDDPYTHEEAEKAAGHGSFNKLPAKRKMETQPSKEEFNEGKRVKVDYFSQAELDQMKSKKRKSRDALNASKEEMQE